VHFYNFSAKAWRNFVVNYTDIVSLCAIGDGFSAIFRKSSAGAGGSRDCRIQRREIKPQLQPADSQLAHAGGCGPGELAGHLHVAHEDRIHVGLLQCSRGCRRGWRGRRGFHSATMRQQRCNSKEGTNEASIAACRKNISSQDYSLSPLSTCFYHSLYISTYRVSRLCTHVGLTLLPPLNSRLNSRQLSRVLLTALMFSLSLYSALS